LRQVTVMLPVRVSAPPDFVKGRNQREGIPSGVGQAVKV
jgi:hypothetical protein